MAIYELPAEPLPEFEDGPSVSGCRLRLRALVAMGHSPELIARALGGGTSARTVQRILRGQTKEIPARQLARIRRLYEAWWDRTPPERTPDERAAAAAAWRRARWNRWCTGMGLDDDLLDELGYDPYCAWRPATGTGVATDNPLKVRRPYR